MLYVVVAIVAYLGGRQQHVFVNRAGEGFLRILRIRVFDHIQRQSLAFFDRNKSGVLVSRMTADIESLAELVQWGVLQFVAAAILLTFSLVVLFFLSWQLTLVALMVLPIIIIASIKFQRDSNAAYLEVRERVGQNLSALQEGISGVRVIQAYAREPEQRRRFRTSNRALYDSHLHSVRVSTWYFGLVEFCGVLATALVIGAGGWLVHRGDLSVGTVVAVVLLLASLFEPVQQLSQLYNTVQSATASLHKLFTILDTEPAVDEHADAVALPSRGDLVVDGVTFSYPGTSTAALVDVSLRVDAGERLALVGPTGAGKSTVAKLMSRLYDPDHGTVSFGDVDLRDATLASLRERIVVVPQEGFLFDGTIADNLRIARPGASDDDVRAALDAIGVLERFEAFPEGPRDAGPRARLAAVGRGAPTRVARPRRARRSGGPRARRSDVEPRSRHRGRGRGRARTVDARPVGGGRRPPAVDRAAGRSHRRRRPRTDRRGRHPRRADRNRRPLRARWRRHGSARRWRRAEQHASSTSNCLLRCIDGSSEADRTEGVGHHGRMIRHCVLFHCSPKRPAIRSTSAAKLLLEYVATLDGVVSYRLGHDVGATDGNYDFGIVGDFETLDAYITYRDSPRHIEIAKGIVAPLLIERATVQFEIPDD